MPGEIRPRASAGVSASDGHTRDELIREADLALIAAKRGRRGALIFTDDLAVREQGYESHNRANHIDLICAALARAVDERHDGMRGHSEAVSEIAALIGTELGLPPGHVARVRRAGLLHDVGKIAISNAILFKREALDRDELEIMQTHPQIGERIAVGAGLTTKPDGFSITTSALTVAATRQRSTTPRSLWSHPSSALRTPMSG